MSRVRYHDPMPTKKITFDTVRTMALALPGVEDSTTHGTPSLKVRGKFLACIAMNKSAEPNTLGIRVSFEDRDELIGAAPEVYYLTDHYVNYPIVLVRLSRVKPDELRDLLGMGWRFVTSKKSKMGRSR